nr:mediator of RNA polymerase II transcription subunit 12 [Tanacetum cinerariifolium]
MGFDNECILNIQSLAGEYFCPVCRTLVYPHEAVQTQCTHLYCKPCLTYVISSTQACPYDGYLVTEAGSKPLMESNKPLAEIIGKTTVHCLYHRSGCVWQGPLSDCTTHCSGCSFGNSPVVCNRCGIQIVHRQVQEHAQTCNVNGTTTQPQGTETAQDVAAPGVTVPTDHSKIVNQAAPPSSQPASAIGHTTAQNVNQPATANPVPQAMPVAPTPEQWYQQQYQQYYQQYPGYDPYQQTYQQYFPYQQQPAQQFSQPPAQLQGQAQNPAQPQSQPFQPQAQIPMQAQQQVQGQAPPQVPSNGQPQPLYSQPQIQAQNQPYLQVQPQPGQSHTQPIMQVPQYPQQHPQPSQPQQPNFQPLSQPPPQSQPFNPQQPPVQSAGGPPTYPSQPHQLIQHAQPQQHPMQVQPSTGSMPLGQMPTQFPPPPPHMRPAQPHMLPSQGQAPGIPPTQPIQPGLPPHQRPMHQAQQQMPQPYMQQPQTYPGQASGPFAQQHPQFPPPGPPQPMQQPPFGFAQPPPHGMPPQSSQIYAGRPAMPNHGGQQQQFPQSSGPAGIAPQARPPQYGPSQPFVNQYAPPPLGGVERRVEQEEDKSSSVKKSESMGTSDFGANVNEVKSEAGVNDERRPGNGVEEDHRKGEALQGSQGDSVTIQRVKEESKDGALDQSPGGKSSQNRTDERGVATTDSVKHGEAGVNFKGSSENDNGSLASQGSLNGRDRMQHGTEQSPHPPVPYAASGQQGPGQPPSHFRPPGHGYLAHGPHSGEYLQPPGSFHPEHFGNNNRGYEPHTRFSRMSQGEQLGPPLNSAPPPHGPPDGQSVPRHPGPMEPDMYQNQRPPYFDGRLADSHLPGDVDMGPYGQPFGVDIHSMRMNGPPPPGVDSSSAPVFRDEKFRNPTGMHPDIFPMAPPRHHDQGDFKGSQNQFPGPPHLGSGGSPKFAGHPSRPMSGYGMDGPSRFHDKDPHGYDYHPAGGLHPNESGGRPLPASMHDDNRGRFDNIRQNPEFPGPMHGFGRHHMDRLPPNSPGNQSRPFGVPHNIDVDGRETDRHPFGERFPMGPPGHMHRGEFDGPGKPRGGEPFGMRNLSGRGDPGFASFQEYGHPGESNGPGGFPHQPPFGEPFGPKSTRPHMGEPGFRSSYSRQNFPNEGGFYAGGPDSLDPVRKRTALSMGWCRICKIDCESVEGLDMHGQTREHQRTAIDMVISIKQKNAKKQKTSKDHRSSREEANKLKNADNHAHVSMS